MLTSIVIKALKNSLSASRDYTLWLTIMRKYKKYLTF